MSPALDYPENYLWVRRDDGTGTISDRDRLTELNNGATPDDETEKALVADPDRLRVYLMHIIGRYPITIAGGPLPEWEPDWLESVE